MKKLLLASLILGTSLVHAATITVLETMVVGARSNDNVDTRFQLDTTTGQGSVKVTVTTEEYDTWNGGGWNGGGWGGCSPYGGCIPRPIPTPIPRIRTLFTDTVEVAGLSLMGDRVVYAAETGDIECGTFGYSNVLRIPTIYLNGNCTTRGTLDRRGNLKVTMITK